MGEFLDQPLRTQFPVRQIVPAYGGDGVAPFMAHSDHSHTGPVISDFGNFTITQTPAGGSGSLTVTKAGRYIVFGRAQLTMSTAGVGDITVAIANNGVSFTSVTATWPTATVKAPLPILQDTTLAVGDVLTWLVSKQNAGGVATFDGGKIVITPYDGS